MKLLSATIRTVLAVLTALTLMPRNDNSSGAGSRRSARDRFSNLDPKSYAEPGLKSVIKSASCPRER